MDLKLLSLYLAAFLAAMAADVSEDSPIQIYLQKKVSLSKISSISSDCTISTDAWVEFIRGYLSSVMCGLEHHQFTPTVEHRLTHFSL